MIRIYNTLSKKKEDFVPLEEGKVTCMCAAQLFTTLSISEMHAR